MEDFLVTEPASGFLRAFTTLQILVVLGPFSPGVHETRVDLDWRPPLEGFPPPFSALRFSRPIPGFPRLYSFDGSANAS